MTTFDGIGYGNGPVRPWSHYGYGDLRCDVIPVLNARTRQYECLVCQRTGSGGGAGVRAVVMSEQAAEADRLLPFEKWLEKPVEVIPGYVWTGEYYVRSRLADDVFPAPAPRLTWSEPDSEPLVREVALLRQIITVAVVVLVAWLLLGCGG